MNTGYNFKEKANGKWEAYHDTTLICGEYDIQEDAVLALADYIKTLRLRHRLSERGFEYENLMFKDYNELLKIKEKFDRYENIRKKLDKTQQRVIESGIGKMFYGITAMEIIATFEHGDYKMKTTSNQEFSLCFVDLFCDNVNKYLDSLPIE